MTNPEEKFATIEVNGKVEKVDHFYLEDGNGRAVVKLEDGREFYVDSFKCGFPEAKAPSLSFEDFIGGCATKGWFFEYIPTCERVYFSDATAGRFINPDTFEMDFERLFDAHKDIIKRLLAVESLKGIWKDLPEFEND